MLKNAFTQIAVIAAIGAMSQAALAADTGNIKFEGEITNSICSLSSKSQNILVQLGKPAAKIFKAAGDKSEMVGFSIDLLDCPPVPTSNANVAKVTFKGVPDSTVAANAGNKWLKLDNAGLVGGSNPNATNVAIQISDSSRQQIDLNSPSPSYFLGEGANSLQFFANYISTAASVTAGLANSHATFQVDYN